MRGEEREGKARKVPENKKARWEIRNRKIEHVHECANTPPKGQDVLYNFDENRLRFQPETRLLVLQSYETE